MIRYERKIQFSHFLLFAMEMAILNVFGKRKGHIHLEVKMATNETSLHLKKLVCSPSFGS